MKLKLMKVRGCHECPFAEDGFCEHPMGLFSKSVQEHEAEQARPPWCDLAKTIVQIELDPSARIHEAKGA